MNAASPPVVSATGATITTGAASLAATSAASTASALPLARLLGHAADAVQAVVAGESLNAALARCPAAARPGTQALSFQTLRWLGAAQAVRSRLVPKAPPPALDALLLTALALLWPDADAPYAPHTLVDQAVAAARRRAGSGAGFVNAVLRRFLRERQQLAAALGGDPLVRFNHPAWWIDRLKADWPGDWQALLDANNQRPPMTLRINARRDDAANYVERLARAGLAGQVAASHAVVLDRPCPVTRLPGFADGDVSVQDAAAQLAAPLLIGGTEEAGAGRLAVPRLAPGARVLDACAAPGGKTAHLLELAELELVALDSDAARLVRVDETLVRLGLRGARTQLGDAGDPAAWWDGRPFDAILLDAPCSASGIVRRHPDVRWLRRAGDIAALAAVQTRLLEALWPLLGPGGRLLYATCSVFKAEGSQPIEAFLQRHREARLVGGVPATGHLLPLPDNRQVRRTPAAASVADGFFYALIEKS